MIAEAMRACLLPLEEAVLMLGTLENTKLPFTDQDASFLADGREKIHNLFWTYGGHGGERLLTSHHSMLARMPADHMSELGTSRARWQLFSARYGVAAVQAGSCDRLQFMLLRHTGPHHIHRLGKHQLPCKTCMCNIQTYRCWPPLPSLLGSAHGCKEGSPIQAKATAWPWLASQLSLGKGCLFALTLCVMLVGMGPYCFQNPGFCDPDVQPRLKVDCCRVQVHAARSRQPLPSILAAAQRSR